MDRPGGTVPIRMKAWSAPGRPFNVGPLCLMHTLFARIFAWFRLGKVARQTVHDHLTRTSKRRLLLTRIDYRLRDVIVRVRHTYRDRAVPLRTYHLFDPRAGTVADVPWSEVRKLVSPLHTTMSVNGGRA